MIKTHVELGGKITVLDVEVEKKEQAIEYIWNKYGIATPIIELFDEFDLKAGEYNGDSSKQ